jgi:uncharacterized protein (DUF1330 family)
MGKAYWVAAYRSVSNPEALAAYAKLAGPAIIAAGGRILARGVPALVYEAGLQERTVLIEFDSVEQAKAAHDSPAYQEALAQLAGGAERATFASSKACDARTRTAPRWPRLRAASPKGQEYLELTHYPHRRL